MTSDEILFQAFMAGVEAGRTSQIRWIRGEYDLWLKSVLEDGITITISVSQNTVTKYENDD